MFVSAYDQILTIPSIGWIHLGFFLLLLALLIRKKIVICLGVAAVITGCIAWVGEHPFFASVDAAPQAFPVWIHLLIFGSFFIFLLAVLPMKNRKKSPYVLPKFSPMVGQVLVLPVSIVEGHAILEVEGKKWNVRGPDLPAGTSVEIIAVDTLTITVQKRGENNGA